MPIHQTERFVQTDLFVIEDYNSVNLCQHFYNQKEINTNFHFPNYNSMDTLSTYLKTAIKNTMFVEANALNNSAKFQLYP